MEYEYLPTPNYHPVRGEIYLCNLGEGAVSIKSGKCPVLIIQVQEQSNPSPTIVVAPITSMLKNLDINDHVLILPDIPDLTKPSIVLIDQTLTVNVSDLLCYYGRVNEQVINKRLNNGITTISRLKRKSSRKKQSKKKFKRYIDTTCLCHKCVSFYLLDQHYRVSRLTPHGGFKDICDRCGSSEGFDYQIFKQGDK